MGKYNKKPVGASSAHKNASFSKVGGKADGYSPAKQGNVACNCPESKANLNPPVACDYASFKGVGGTAKSNV